MELKHCGIIELKDLEFFAFHGCYPEEQAHGNKFVVNIKIETDISLPAQTDNIEDALDYVKIYDIVEKEMSQRSHLLENVAFRIYSRLFEQFPQIINADVKVSKLAPSVRDGIKAVSVRI
ncbi:MAG: dihydroneopterin aldolase [Marinilabiliaceae bacterium]|nr:dihydroneopterin aldolase [Marinilabiliaceae bacterium]